MKMPKSPIQKFRRRYVRPSFAEGMARLMDVGGSLNRYTAADFERLYRDLRARRLARPAGPDADAQAIRDCWLAVGNDLRDAMGLPQVQAKDAKSWRDLIPSPELLQEYEKKFPGAVEQILATAERRQQRRLAQEKAFWDREQYELESIRADYRDGDRQSKWGLITAFVITLAGMGGGVYLINAGWGGYGLACLAAPLISFAGMLVYQVRVRRRRNSY